MRIRKATEVTGRLDSKEAHPRRIAMTSSENASSPFTPPERVWRAEDALRALLPTDERNA